MSSLIHEKRKTKHPSSRQDGSIPISPFDRGMPSLVDGASRKDLPDAMRTKMENAFGADFSNLNIYESEKVAEGGARAVTQGNTIAFAPGEFNLYSPTGEALLGHELSHVVSQARGESRGGGLVDNAYLEAKADREGVMAAAGQQVYSGPLTPLSDSSPMSVAGPMQCKKSNEGGKSREQVVREGFAEKGKDDVYKRVEMLGNMQNYLMSFSEDDKHDAKSGYDAELGEIYGKIIDENMNKKQSSRFTKAFADRMQQSSHDLISPLVEDQYWMNKQPKAKPVSGFGFMGGGPIKREADPSKPMPILDQSYLSSDSEEEYGYKLDPVAYGNYRAMKALEDRMLSNPLNKKKYDEETKKEIGSMLVMGAPDNQAGNFQRYEKTAQQVANVYQKTFTSSNAQEKMKEHARALPSPETDAHKNFMNLTRNQVQDVMHQQRNYLFNRKSDEMTDNERNFYDSLPAYGQNVPFMRELAEQRSQVANLLKNQFDSLTASLKQRGLNENDEEYKRELCEKIDNSDYKKHFLSYQEVANGVCNMGHNQDTPGYQEYCARSRKDSDLMKYINNDIWGALTKAKEGSSEDENEEEE